MQPQLHVPVMHARPRGQLDLLRAQPSLRMREVRQQPGHHGEVRSPDDLDLDGDTVNDALSITPATVDFDYYANAGVFGNSAVYGALHAPDGKAMNGVVNILNGLGDPEATYTDNFAGNNDDLTSGAVHLGLFEDAFTGLTDAGTYRIVITGNLKENGATRLMPFSVGSNQINIGIGSCNNPN